MENLHKRILLLGHSFVHRVQDHNGEDFMDQLNVYNIPDHCEIYVEGFPGASVDALVTHHLHQVMQYYNPDVVILDIGGNDLDRHGNSGKPSYVGESIITLMDTLKEGYNVGLIVWCQALNRGKCRQKTILDYNTDVHDLNGIMKHRIEEAGHTHIYWTHRGFWKVPLEDWTSDGIHPNTTSGRKKYIISVCKAIKYSISVVNHMEVSFSNSTTCISAMILLYLAQVTLTYYSQRLSNIPLQLGHNTIYSVTTQQHHLIG